MFSQPINDFLEKYRVYRATAEPAEGVAKIHVDEIGARLSGFYERLRSIIDYQEEHLLRKGAIARVFKRRFFLAAANEHIAEGIIKDIIRAGHLKNDSVPEQKIIEVQEIVDRFRFLLEHVSGATPSAGSAVAKWLIIIAIGAIEESLFPATRELALAELMFFSLKTGLAVGGANMSDDNKNLQLYIGVQRALLRVDDDQLTYRLFHSVHPNWAMCATEECLEIAKELPGLKEKITHQLQCGHAGAFFVLANRYNTIFDIIGDLADTQPSAEELSALFLDESRLEAAVALAYQKRYSRERERLSRLAMLSVISFLISKIAIAIGIEIPIDFYITHNFSATSTLINIAFPPLLVLVIIASIAMPSQKNLQLVLGGARDVIFPERARVYSVIIRKKKRLLTQTAVWLFYLLTAAASLYALFKILVALHFSVANMVVFTLFTSLVAATGVKIRNRARALSLEEEKSTLASFVLDLFAMPYVTIGRWAIAGLSRFNILVIVANLLVEVPFQIFIEFLENFRSFIKSQKEEIR